MQAEDWSRRFDASPAFWRCGPRWAGPWNGMCGSSPCGVFRSAWSTASTTTRSSILGPRQITGTYLLALAVHHGGRFVTFDRAAPLEAVAGATASHLVAL